MRRVLFGATALLCLLSLARLSFAQEFQRSDINWHPWFEIGGYASNERSRGEATLWAPLWQGPRALVFTDIRGKFFDEDQQEGNFALGLRQMLADDWNVGGWVSYDVRTSRAGSAFNQVSFGIEALHPFWDFRLNGYVPTDDDKLIDHQTFTSNSSISTSTTTLLSPALQLSGNQLQIVSGGLTTTTTTTTSTKTTSDIQELALWGFDGEIGFKLPISLGQLENTANHELRLYAGGYYFDNPDFEDFIAGPKLRLEYRINDVIQEWSGSRLTLETQYQWDNVRGDQFEVGARLRIPFGEKSSSNTVAALSAQEQRMTERIERDTDIVFQTKRSVATTAPVTATAVTTQQTVVRENVEDALTGADFDRVIIAQNGSNLQAALTTAGENSLIIAQGGANAFGQAVLAANQTLVGGGGTVQVRGLVSGAVLDFTAPGSRAHIDFPDTTWTQPVVTVASNTHIANVDITGAGVGYFAFPADNSGILVPTNTSNVYVTNVDISKVHVHGIFVHSNSQNINVIDSRVRSVDHNGITGHDNISINVLRTRIEVTYGAAFHFLSNTVATLNEVTFEGTNNFGLFGLFPGPNNVVSGANNVNNAVVPPNTSPICRGEGSGFSGSISFVNGDVWQDNVAPCN